MTDGLSFQYFARVILDQSFPFVYSGVIVGAAVLLLAGMVRARQRLARDLDSAVELVAKTTGEAEFARRFDAIDNVLARSPLLGHSWKEFKETLIFWGSDEEPLIRNSIETSHFLNDSLVARELHLRFYASVPNWLTGAGILGTFLGLFAGIWHAQGGLASPNPAEMITALQQLLKGASLAFLTSIAGILSSISFAVVEKRIVRGLHLRVTKLSSAIDARLRFTTPEQVIREQLAEQKEQTLQLKRFNTELALSIADALEEKVANRLTESLERLIQAVDRVVADRAETNDKVLQGVVEEFKASITGAAGSQFDDLAKTLGHLNATITASTSSLQESQTELRDSSQVIASNVKGAIDQAVGGMHQSLSDALQKIAGRLEESSETLANRLTDAGGAAADSLGESASAVKGSVLALNELIRGTSDLLERTNATVGQLQQAGDTLLSVHRDIATTAKSLGATSSALGAAGEASKQAMQQADALSASMKADVDRINELHQRLEAAWESYQTRFQGVDASLEKVFAAMRDGLGEYTRQVNKFMTELDGQTSKAIRDLGGAVSELGESIEELTTVRDRTST